MSSEHICYKNFKILRGIVQFTGTVEMLACGIVKVTTLFGHV